MRKGLTLTRGEKRQIEKAIQKLDESYQRGTINPMVYRDKRGKLLANLNRPLAARTPINLNQKGFFKNRSDVHFGPSPIGYWDQTMTTNGANMPQRRVSSNKIRASLINIADNGYWNSNNFQEAIQTASKATQNAREENKSYFQQAVMKSKVLGSAQATLTDAGVWNEIQSSEPVVKAMKRLEDTISYTVQRMYAVGISKQQAMDAIKRSAIATGKSMTASGYSKENAARLIAMVIRGEIGVEKAIAEVAGDLNQVAANVAAINQNSDELTNAPTASRNGYRPSWNDGYNIHANQRGRTNTPTNKPHSPWNNGFDIHGNGTPTGVSTQALMQAKNQLEQRFDLSNNPVERNELSQQISQIEQTLNQRQQGADSVRRSFKKPNNGSGGPVEATYNPRNNFRANNSLMQQTSAALNRGGPSITTVVKDIFTIDANMYLDWTSGNPIAVANNGSYTNATKNSDPSRVFPSGVWTVFAGNANAVPALKSIVNSIGYALASPLWSEGDRAYLTYLKQITEERIANLAKSNLLSVMQEQSIQQMNQNNSGNLASEMEEYGQYLASLSSPELAEVFLPKAYHYLKVGINYVGPDFAGDEMDIMLQVAGSEEQQAKDLLLFMEALERIREIEGDENAYAVILHELYTRGYNLSFLAERPDLVHMFMATLNVNERNEFENFLIEIGLPTNSLGVSQNNTPINTNQINNAAIQQERRAAQQAQRMAQQQSRLAQQAQRLAQQKQKAFQQEQRRLAQQEAKRIRQAQQAERKAAQQAERRANQERRAAQQAAKAAEQAARKAAQQAEAKAAQQAARQAQQAKQNLPPSLNPLPIRPGRGFPGGPSLGPSLGPSRPSFGLRGSTSSTMSTRSHGGARFVNDPRAIYRG